MNYLDLLLRIEESLSALDKTSYNTIEEANKALIKYDKLNDEIFNIIRTALDDYILSIEIRESICNKAIVLLARQIGTAIDTEKYSVLIDSLYEGNMITKQQINLFYDNLNIGRWN